MNERIKQLAKKSGFSLDANNIYTAKLEHLPITENMEKFAELIVEEFRNVLADEYRKTPLECCGHFLRADETIAKHFYGVEE